MQLRDGPAGKLLESRHRHRIVGVDDVDKMMRHGSLFLGRRLGRADIHAAIHLIGIGIDDLRTLATFGQTPGDGDAQTGFA